MGLELVKNPDICILEKEREKVRMKRGESKSSIWYCTHTHTVASASGETERKARIPSLSNSHSQFNIVYSPGKTAQK